MLFAPKRSDLMRLMLLGDSYGCSRIHDGVTEVAKEETWPCLVATALGPVASVKIDFAPFRMLVECPAYLEKAGIRHDLIVLACGIVDCYPRPTGRIIGRSQAKHHRLMRRAIRSVRPFWMRYVNSTRWASDVEIDAALDAIEPWAEHCVFTTVPPLPRRQESETRGANAVIDVFNARIWAKLANRPRWSIVDLHTSLLTDPEALMHSVDAHYNVAGNALVARLVINHLESIPQWTR